MRGFVESEGDRSRREIARVINVDESTIRGWEKDTGPTPKLELIYKFCDHFNVPLWEFLGEQDALVLEIEELEQRVEFLEGRLASVHQALVGSGEDAEKRQA